MENDDRPVGRLLSRREALALFGAAGAALVAACAPAELFDGTSEPSIAPTGTTIADLTTVTSLPACVVRPELTEGPYFVDEGLNRSDIRSDPAAGVVKEGVMMALTFAVSMVGATGCTPLVGAIVDVWHCDADGLYSDVADPTFNTVGQQFLRGYQVTGADGQAHFTTIYPGWYPGRTVHIHFKIRGTLEVGEGYEFTSQLFFDDALTDRLYANPPYAGRGERSPRNEGDGIFAQSGGLLTLSVDESGAGLATTFDIGLQI